MSGTSHELPAAAVGALDQLARTEHLLVATDFDGTISEIVAVPSAATPDADSVAALKALALLPRTTVAVVSGRSLEVLRQLTGLHDVAHLVGSHGMEFDSEFAAGLTTQEQDRLTEINRRAEVLTAQFRGLEVERKPASTAIHYRHVASAQRQQALVDIQSGPCTVEGAQVIAGKMVVEVAAVQTSKGAALERLRAQDAASAVVFLGDDVTDEDAFVRLSGDDVGVKVGPGRTAAAVRIADTAAVARFLRLLVQRRREHVGR